jgi:uncharacterized protein (DUF433 family)
MSLTTKEKIPFLKIENDRIPLNIDKGGAIRVGKTRITLDTIVTAFKQGLAAEEIVWKFPTLDLADVYAVISYYLRRREEIDTYLYHEEEAIRQQYPKVFTAINIRENLLLKKQETVSNDKVPC